jgi:hypothetical protein
MSTSAQTSDCGCCEGVTKVTPLTIQNLPGLSTISYRIGIQPQFKETMIASLSQNKYLKKYPVLSQLTTRSDDDLTMDLFDAWATVADVLTFYQERFANEGFLRTAKERLSVLQLARSIGYELSPGVAASTYLAFTLDATGSVTQTAIKAGTKVQSMPLQGQVPPQLPQTYETVQSIIAYPQFNNLQPSLTVPQTQADIDGSNHVYFVGTSTKLNPGDKLLVVKVSKGVQTPSEMRTVLSVTPDASLQQTDVELTPDAVSFDDSPPTLEYRSQWSSPPSGPSTPSSVNDLSLANVQQIMSSYPTQSSLVAYLAQQGWDAADFADVVNSYGDALSPPPDVLVYALRVSAGIFGSSAPAWKSLPLSMTTGPPSGWTAPSGTGTASPPPGPYPANWDQVATVFTDSQGNEYEPYPTIYLSGSYPTVAKDTWVVLQSRGTTCAYLVDDAWEDTLADFLLTSKVTGLSLTLGPFASSLKAPPSGAFAVSLSAANGPAGCSVTLSATSGGGTAGTSGTTGTAGTTGTTGATGTQGTTGTPGTTGTSGTSGAPTGTSGATGTQSVRKAEFLPPSAEDLESEPEETPQSSPRIDMAGLPPQKASPGSSSPRAAPLFFTPNATYYFYFGGTSLGSTQAASGGSFSFQFVVPSTAAPGIYPITVTDQNGNDVPVFMEGTPDSPLAFEVLFSPRGTNAFAQPELLELAALPDNSAVEGAGIKLDTFVAGLQIDQNIAVTGLLSLQTDQSASETASEILTISDIDPFSGGSPPVTTIYVQSPTSLVAGLANSYERATVTINANVALATHGSTVSNEALGSGDPSQPYLEFTLRQASQSTPLTFVPSATQTGAASTLVVSVSNGGPSIPWNLAPSLYNIPPASQSYAVRIQDDETVNVLFGAARPPVGTENITATYRVGIGLVGMVQANQLTLLASRPLGLRSVTNPLPSSGAADPQDIDDARENAPLTVLTMGRIVSLTDCENFARSYQGIGKAVAVSAWAGETEYIRLIVASATQGQVTGTLLSSLQGSISNFADPSIQVSVEPYTPLTFNVEGWIEPDTPEIQQAVLAALQSKYSFASMGFGQPVYLSDVIATIQQVQGVTATNVTGLYVYPGPASSNPTLACDVDELLILNPDQQGVNLSVNPSP